MVPTKAIEGTVNERFVFRYDATVDVLYIHSPTMEGHATKGDLTDEGDTRLRDQKSGEVTSLTVENFWKRYGNGGGPPASAAEVRRVMEPVVRGFEGACIFAGGINWH